MNDVQVQSKEPGGQLLELTIASSKQLMRDLQSILSIVIMFGFLCLMTFGIAWFVNYSNEAKATVFVAEIQNKNSLMSELQKQGILTTEDPSTVVPNVTVSGGDGDEQVLISVDSNNRDGMPQWLPVHRALEAAGVEPSQISVVDADGFVLIDYLRQNLPSLMLLGVLLVSLNGLSVQLVTLRKHGLLTLLATTPVSKTKFVVAQTPVRFLIALAMLCCLIGVSAARGYLDPLGVVRLTVTVVLGTVMMMSVGFLLGSRSKSIEAISVSTLLITMLTYFAGGYVFPRHLLPGFVNTLLDWIPSSWFLQAVGEDLVGVSAQAPVPVLWLLMAGITLLCTLVTARLFSWGAESKVRAR